MPPTRHSNLVVGDIISPTRARIITRRHDPVAEPRAVVGYVAPDAVARTAERRVNWDVLLLKAQAEREKTQTELCRVYLLNHLGIDDADAAANIVHLINGVR